MNESKKSIVNPLLFFIFFSSVILFGALQTNTDSIRYCESLGCAVKPIIDYLALPAWPINKFFRTHLYETPYLTDVYSFPSIAKVSLVFSLIIYTYLLIYLLIYFLGRMNPGVHLIKKRLTKSIIILGSVVLLMSLMIMFPFAPLASRAQIAGSCKSFSNRSAEEPYINDKCIKNYLHSILPNCKNETKMFVYPFKIELPQKDKCMFENFIAEKPFSKTLFYDYSYYIKSDPPLFQSKDYINYILQYFDEFIKDGDVKLKNDVCGAFSPKKYRNENVFTNRDFCRYILLGEESYTEEVTKDVLARNINNECRSEGIYVNPFRPETGTYDLEANIRKLISPKDDIYVTDSLRKIAVKRINQVPIQIESFNAYIGCVRNHQKINEVKSEMEKYIEQAKLSIQKRKSILNTEKNNPIICEHPLISGGVKALICF